MAQNKKFSIIVPLYKDNYRTLDKFLLHLKEQDYKNFEIIFVHNSPDPESKTVMRGKKSPMKLFKGADWMDIDAGYDPKLKTGNHCRAFNEGAKLAKGDYLLFLDPDVYLLPGVLREYKEQFEKHPEADFVYGDHDFIGAGRVFGRPYSEYELYCANYISGAFPIKKEAFRGWDEKIESLQDWDMWLSAVDAGAKGHYFEHPCFETEPPTEDGISANQAKNWATRYPAIRAKHGRPVADTVVTSLGAPHHATNAAKILGADSRVRNTLHNFKPHDYKNIYVLGFYPQGWEGHMRLFYELGDLQKKIVGERRIIHWIGTDIYQMQHKLSWTAVKNIVAFLNDPEFGFIHLAECEATQKELQELGISAEIVPLPPGTAHDLALLPEKFTVGVYINPTQDMYFEDFMEQVADSMPDVQFKFFGGSGPYRALDNKEWVGWVDMAEFLPTISALVRITRHDGLPVGPIEAMQAGRNVLCTQPMEHAITAKLVNGQPVLEDVVAQIREMEKLPLNTKGSDYWIEEVSPERYIERMSKYLV